MELDIQTRDAALDIDLQAEVRAAIRDVEGVRATRAEVDAVVVDGHATISGYVHSPMQAAEVARTAEYVPGVVSVTNEVYDDGTMMRATAMALALDERTRAIPPGYQVNVVFGHIMLIGRFTNDEARAAMAVAQSVRGVRTVNIKTLN